MCGIAGFVSSRFDRALLEKMTRILQHRGPDAEGFFYDVDQQVGFGHRRLSILDLSDSANQPFFSQDGRYAMVYNGEVYNFREIASKYNINPVTYSDSEIVIEAFSKAGIDAIKDFNGMFAIAIWDREEQSLFLIRDRVGIKPLYYFRKDNEIAFASELKALFVLPDRRELEHNSIADFLYLGYIPGEATIYKNHFKILPGHYAIWVNGEFSLHSYWKPEEQLEKTTVTDETAAKKHLRTLLESSVNYCMISDVPVGVFLSGGIDSSTVAAVAQSTSAVPIQTFSIGFKEAKYNESRFAAKVARHINSSHNEFIVTENDALHLIDKMPDIFDEPYADSSAIPTYLVSQLARKDVKVALTGDGGDELFLGYGFYFWARRLSNPLIKTFRKPIAELTYRLGKNREKRASYLFRYPSRQRIKSHIFSQEQYLFTESEIKDLIKTPASVTINEEIRSTARSLSLVEEQAIFDIKNYLPEELLVKADRSSMQHGLEVRVPLLDHRLVEFAVNLSPDLRLKGKIGKYLLKQVLYDYVPAEMFNKPKWGFSVPLNIWFKNELRYLFDKYLSPFVVESCGLVNIQAVERLKKEYFDGKDYLYLRLWVLIVLHKWYKEKHQ